MEQIILTDSQGNSSAIVDLNGLLDNLKKIHDQSPQIEVLRISGFGYVSFGVSQEFGFIEYMEENYTPPYLYAIKNPIEFTGEYLEFDAGGTITPIHKNKCIPYELLIKILIDVFKERKLPDYVDWIEE